MSTLTEQGTTTVTSPRVPAKPPVAAPAATVLAGLLALTSIAVGVIAARDVLIWTGAITGTPWIATALNVLDGLTAEWWMLPAGIAVAVLGLLLVFAAVKPRRRTHRPLQVPDTWITPRDVIRMTRGAGAAITGVATATATGSARRITLTIIPLAGYDAAAVKDAVGSAVAETLAALAQPPRVKIRIKERELL
jgi:hypothetical protein